MLQIHRQDGEYLLSTQYCKFKKPGMRPENLVGFYGIETVEILSEDKTQNTYVCLAKIRWVDEDIKLFFKDPGMILCVPLIIDEKSILISFITDNGTFDKVWEEFQNLGDKFKVRSISNVSPPKDDLYLLLTDRQREIIVEAIKSGYYEIPRNVNTVALAEKCNISQSALSEHLRKIERAVFRSVFKF